MNIRLAKLAAVALVVLLVAGCDKCGHTLKLVSPSLPNACGDNADPGRG